MGAAPVPTDSFLSMGNETLKRRRRVSARTEMARYRAMFGTSPENCAAIWSMIISSGAVFAAGAKPIHLLWALMLMKIYCSESVLATLAGGVHEQTFRKWSWHFVDHIANLQYSLILWQNRFIGDIGNACLVSIDGTDFQIYQWQPFWTGWYSHKFKGPGVRYEVGVCILTGDIVWIHGPYPCGRWPDLKIFRSALKGLLAAAGGGEKVAADKGCRGESQCIVTPTGDSSDDVGKNARGRHETVNKRFKQWNILHRVFRHDVAKHQAVFSAVASITQIAINNGEPLYGLSYNDSAIADD